jgi:hypothetical protein
MVSPNGILGSDVATTGGFRSGCKSVLSLHNSLNLCKFQFVAKKIFSILPNSMAEERTVSRFTRNDSVDRASQDASTIVAMTKIYQHNRRAEAALDTKSVC